MPLEAKTRNSVITAMCKLAANSGLLWDAGRMADAVKSREDLQSTAMDNGVALLHPRRPIASILGAPVMALGQDVAGHPVRRQRNPDRYFLADLLDGRPLPLCGRWRGSAASSLTNICWLPCARPPIP